MTTIYTPRGAELQFIDHPMGNDDVALLSVKMTSPFDRRRVELLLSDDNIDEMIYELSRIKLRRQQKKEDADE